MLDTGNLMHFSTDSANFLWPWWPLYALWWICFTELWWSALAGSWLHRISWWKL